ncbi:protein melted isoform X2 [Bradysia coprophila]|uniref:protein melted isoform X2 n=1 Tax=Bradysia coprophila TaxID=38358 RepID=UPI00187D82AD|nr:protein melted isoform X2 [Bradysia coprophila]
MHDLFTKVLSKRDLSRAGDLFSVADYEIVNDLTQVLTEIDSIISQPDYLKNNNDQSVVEICVTRVLSCIRETKTAERHCNALVSLLNTCLKHNLQPSSNKEDPPHAKISADIISSLFLNYNKKTVMEIALPVAVKFLRKGNKELSKNLASYLSLAAIEYAYLLSSHIQAILDSISAGNYGLCRLLSQIYEVSPEQLTPHAALLVSLLPVCDIQERLALLQLFALMVQNDSNVLETSVSQLCEHLTNTATVSTIAATMQVLLKLTDKRPELVLDHFDKIKKATQETPSTISLAAQILSTAGKVNKEKAQFALDFVLEHLPHADRTSQTVLLHEATMLCSTYPILFTDKVLACVRHRNNLLSQSSATSSQNSEVNQIKGGVTIVKLNSPSQEISPSTNLALTPGRNIAKMVLSTVTLNGTNAVASTSSQNTTTSGHVVTINTSSVTTTPISTGTTSTGNVTAASVVSPTAPHTGYTRRAKLGDSRSTGRLYSAGNTHRSGSVGGLHKSMTRLSSSQQINQNGGSNAAIVNNNFTSSGNFEANGVSTSNYVTPVPPLSSNVIITGHNKWGIPSTKITSGGVTVLTLDTKDNRHNKTTSPRMRPHSQGPSTLMGSTGALGKLSGNALNQSTGSIGLQQNAISVHHASPASPTFPTNQKSVMTLPINSTLSSASNNNHEVSVSGPMTITSRRTDNTSVTLINANTSIINQRMSTFEPYQIMRDTVQQFCEKHFTSIKVYMDKLSQRLPPPLKCGIEERRTKKVVKLHFACQIRGPHCLYSKTCFTMRTRNPKTWIHLMFLDFQIRNYVKDSCALSSREPGISNLKNMWNMIKTENKSFTELVTSNFPSVKEQEALVNELRHSGFLDVFEVSKTDRLLPNANELEYQWGCFLCNHPEKAVGFLHGTGQPMIEGQLKEKKGKWRLFRRWRTRYFTLSGAHLSCKGSSGGESIDVNQIRSVKVSRGARNIPKAFEIFTGDQTLILKPKDGKNAEEWVQCLSIVVAHSQARDNPTAKTASLPARGLGNSRTAF